MKWRFCDTYSGALRNDLTVITRQAYKTALAGATSFQMSDCRGSVGASAIRRAGGQNKSALTAEVSLPVATYTPIKKPISAETSANQIAFAFMTERVNREHAVVNSHSTR